LSIAGLRVGASDGFCRVVFLSDRRNGFWACHRHGVAVVRLSPPERIGPMPVIERRM